MKRILISSLLLSMANLGCLNMDQLSFSWKEKGPAAVQTPDAPTVSRKEKPVTADQIREENARDKLNSLMLELERDEQGALRIDASAEVNAEKK